MARESVHVVLDPFTSAVLRAYAQSRRQTREEAIAALLYRAAAGMTGWPGQQGAEFERAWLAQAQPTADGDDIGAL